MIWCFNMMMVGIIHSEGRISSGCDEIYMNE